MTRTDRSPGADHAADALGAYLDRVDVQLARSGLTRSERDATCRQIAEQFHDLLGGAGGKATAAQVEAALEGLGSEAAYESDDLRSWGQVLRMAWNRFWIGIPAPLAVNDRGRRRVLWPELVKRLAWVCATALSAGTVTMALLMPERGLYGLLLVATFTAVAASTLVLRVLRMPVESLPRAEHWLPDRRPRHRAATLLVAVGSAVFLLGLYPAAYSLCCLLSNRPAWPVDRSIFLGVVLVLTGLIMAPLAAEGWRRRRRRRALLRWACAESAADGLAEGRRG